PTSAQQTGSSAPASATNDPQAVAAVKSSLSALVGQANVADVTLTGNAQWIAGSAEESGTATLQAMAGGYSQLSLSLSSGPRSEIRNPSAIPLPGGLPADIPASVAQTPQPVGAWSGVDGALHPIAQHNLLTDATWFFPAFTLGNLTSSQGYVLSYIGLETLNGQQVVHVSASEPFPTAPTQVSPLLRHLSQMDLYFNSTTLLPVALDFNVHPDNNAGLDIPIEIQFSSYQPINGVQVPFHVQKYLNNDLVLDLQLNNATLNSGLTAAAFQLQ